MYILNLNPLLHEKITDEKNPEKFFYIFKKTIDILLIL